MTKDRQERRWPRVTLILPPDASDTLGRLAAEHLRDPRREALRILLEGIDREAAGAPSTRPGQQPAE